MHRLALTPLYNAPLLAPSLGLLLALAAPALLLHLAARQPASPRRLDARACLALSAFWTDAAALFTRRVGSATGVLGARAGATAARGVLGLGTVAGATGFALVCLDAHRSDATKTVAAGCAAAYVALLWLLERLLEPVVRAWLARDPEKGMLPLSFAITAIGLFLRPPPATPRISSRLPASLRPYLAHASLLTLLRVPLVLAHVITALARPATPYLAAGGAVRILSSEMGTTGRVVVGEHVESAFRFLRVDAGLVGGYWLRRKGGELELGDSIFATFPLQEIGVLVDGGEPDAGARTTIEIETGLRLGAALHAPPRDESALIIGLGVGVTASGFVRRGMAVDVVELDPAVHAAAVAHFGLDRDPPRAVHLADGAAFVAAHAEAVRNASAAKPGARTDTAAPEKYDHVVQDCYTGGQVPRAVFTREFWEDVRDILNPGGVVVMNFAGLIRARSARQALYTLLAVFPQCRAFGDGLEAHLTAHDLANLVVVCVAHLDPLLTFRAPAPADVGRSPLRAHVFSTLHANEVDLGAIVFPRGGEMGEDRWRDQGEKEGLMLRAADEGARWGQEGAEASWRAMRDVMTPAMWRVW
ncbi:hypothetical protein Q5752_004404 [Cryptotrichosporon argae]